MGSALNHRMRFHFVIAASKGSRKGKEIREVKSTLFIYWVECARYMV